MAGEGRPSTPSSQTNKYPANVSVSEVRPHFRLARCKPPDARNSDSYSDIKAVCTVKVTDCVSKFSIPNLIFPCCSAVISAHLACH